VRRHHRPRHLLRRRGVAAASLFLAAATLVAAIGEPGAGAASAGACPLPSPGLYAPPVAGVVIDWYRPPVAFAGAGNRGWEYQTTAGSPVRAAGAGIVAFAGPVAGRLVVAIAHPDGLRTTYTGLAALAVSAGVAVGRGAQIAIAADTLHFGVRCSTEYVDPGVLFPSTGLGRPHLVPVPGTPRRAGGGRVVSHRYTPARPSRAQVNIRTDISRGFPRSLAHRDRLGRSV
jgi:murein DD-endopeptidase MepM/ murein hydrolase activator NlpD